MLPGRTTPREPYVKWRISSSVRPKSLTPRNAFSNPSARAARKRQRDCRCNNLSHMRLTRPKMSKCRGAHVDNCCRRQAQRGKLALASAHITLPLEQAEHVDQTCDSRASSSFRRKICKASVWRRRLRPGKHRAPPIIKPMVPIHLFSPLSFASALPGRIVAEPLSLVWNGHAVSANT